MALPCVPRSLKSKVLFSYGDGIAVDFLDGFVAIVPIISVSETGAWVYAEGHSIRGRAGHGAQSSEMVLMVLVASTRHGHDGDIRGFQEKTA